MWNIVAPGGGVLVELLGLTNGASLFRESIIREPYERQVIPVFRIVALHGEICISGAKLLEHSIRHFTPSMYIFESVKGRFHNNEEMGINFVSV